MGTETGTARHSGPGTGKEAAAEGTGLLAALDRQIMRHRSSISFVTEVLAVLGVGTMAVGVARVSPLLKALSPF
jgi:hypothetical protein